jgi:O-antigen ligase
MWMLAGSKLLADPLALVFGFGPGAFWGRNYPLHSEYVSTLHQFGLIGITLMFGYIITTFRALVRRKDTVMLAAFVIIGLDMVGDFPVEVVTTAFLIIIVCALIERDRLAEIRGKV